MAIAMAISKTTRFFVTWVAVFCLSGDVRDPILLAFSLEVTISILNSMIHDDAESLSCRALFRRPPTCYCRRFVSDYVPFSLSNQFVSIGPRRKWRYRQLSFPSTEWFGDVIWIFDPGTLGTRIDNEGDAKTYFIQTPVHNNGSTQGQRIWWKEIMFYVSSRTYHGNFLPCISLSIKEFGRPPVASLNLWGCPNGTRFTGWYSLPFYGEDGARLFSALDLVEDAIKLGIRRSNPQHVWVNGTITNNHISFCRRVPKSRALRCNGWIAGFGFRKRKRWYIDKKQMFPKLESHKRLTDKARATKHIIRIAEPYR